MYEKGTCMTTQAKKRTGKERGLSNLRALIPSEEFAEFYVHRNIGGVKDTEILAKARLMCHNTLIYGPTGPGKTSMVLAYAAEKRLPFYSVPCNGAIDPRQLFGSWIPTTEAGKYKWVDGPVTTMVRRGGVLLLNEVNFVPPRIAAVLYSLLDMRREMQLIDHNGEVIKAHQQFQVVADYNPDYEGTRPLNEAFKNRFAIKLRFDYEPTIEAKLFDSKTLHAITKQLRDAHRRGEVDTPISTNMMVEFEDLVFELGLDFAIENFLNAFSAEERSGVAEVVKLHREALVADFENVEFVGGAEEEEELNLD